MGKEEKFTKISKGVRKTFKVIDKTAEKIIPDQKADNHKITDTGTESVKSTIHTGKTAIKTTKNTIKVTKSTIKTVKNAPKNIKRAAKATYKAAQTTVKVIKATVQVITKVISHLAAALSNPVVLIILLIVIVVVYIIFACVTVLGGATAGEAKTKQAYSEAAGLENVPEQLKQGMEIIKQCKEDKKKAYDEWIDSHYFDYNNLKDSDLIYMKRYDKDNNETEYQKGLASPEQKQVLKNALDWNSGIDDYEILAIAYVLAEKEKNEIDINAEYKINKIKYTKELINKVIDDKVVKYYNSYIYEWQECPGKNCTQKIEYVENPEWRKYAEGEIKYTEASSAWWAIHDLISKRPVGNSSAESSYWKANDIDGKIQEWKEKYEYDWNYGVWYTPYWNDGTNGYAFYEYLFDVVRLNYQIMKNNTRQYNEIITYCCEHKHKLYSKGLEFFNKEEIMNILGFNDVDKYWEELTEIYLRTVSEEEKENNNDS